MPQRVTDVRHILSLPVHFLSLSTQVISLEYHRDVYVLLVSLQSVHLCRSNLNTVNIINSHLYLYPYLYPYVFPAASIIGQEEELGGQLVWYLYYMSSFSLIRMSN
jgi:hypothetical protein